MTPGKHQPPFNPPGPCSRAVFRMQVMTAYTLAQQRSVWHSCTRLCVACVSPPLVCVRLGDIEAVVLGAVFNRAGAQDAHLALIISWIVREG